MIDEKSSLKLSDTMPASTKILFKQLLKSKCIKAYPIELKNFALTLSFYSPRAYLYIRKTFTNMLPHPRTLQKWYKVITRGPGFQSESVKVLKLKSAELKENGKSCICSLMIDEMAFHKKIEWDGEKFLGYVDIGSELQLGISGVQKRNFIKMCLKILSEADITIASLTFDGVLSNISNHLGADLSVNSTCTYFPHPVTKKPDYIIMDPPHMLKLIRNTFGMHKIIFDCKNEPIKWDYIEKLVAIQEKEGLHLATKITK
ncbi:uncharacterized protein LOC101238854 isoform X4 [Hydra vulgaris]|uniref:Uncharacterized protein LOC101238854 isoform X4 n=1 Tax=Hydra vulgaris TaxID=6087 RepID=A0ABM4C0F7_HYDVU